MKIHHFYLQLIRDLLLDLLVKVHLQKEGRVERHFIKEIKREIMKNFRKRLIIKNINNLNLPQSHLKTLMILQEEESLSKTKV